MCEVSEVSGLAACNNFTHLKISDNSAARKTSRPSISFSVSVFIYLFFFLLLFVCLLVLLLLNDNWIWNQANTCAYPNAVDTFSFCFAGIWRMHKHVENLHCQKDSLLYNKSCIIKIKISISSLLLAHIDQRNKESPLNQYYNVITMTSKHPASVFITVF